MLFSYFCMICTLEIALAALQNTATYRGTTLKYYNKQQDTTTFLGASLSCQRKGGELVMPKDNGLNTAVGKVAQYETVWIGGGDFLSEGFYEWIDGTPLEWTNWRDYQPDNTNSKDPNGEDCININWKSQYTWNDTPCCLKAGYVCQIPETQSKAHEYQYSEFTVFSGINGASYVRAQRICKQRRSRLVSIENSDQFQHLKEAINDPSLNNFWVDKKADWTNACNVVSWNSIHTTNCELSLPFACEEVAPHDLSVSNEAPDVLEGTGVEIECSATGLPLPSVAWYRDGTLVPNQNSGEARSTLVLDDLTQADAGLYVCRAINEIGGIPRQMEGYSIIEVTRQVYSDHRPYDSTR